MPPLPPDARRSLLVYNLLFPLVFLALLPGLLVRMVRRGGFRENLGQRFGRYSAETQRQFATGRWWWIHSISVGETGVALKLARELHHRSPDLRLVISVTTSTGFAIAQKAAGDWLIVLYNPLDAPGIVRAALDLIRPERLLLIEGEAWPNLLAACHDRGIPATLVNARLSPRSERRMLTARHWIAPIFRLLDRILLPEEADRARWQNLGLPADRLVVTGSIKFDPAGDPPLVRQTEFRQLLDSLGVPAHAPILVAGSTWPPEELILAEHVTSLRREFPDLFLILVPRHIERTAQILRDLTPTGLTIARRSTLPGSAATAASTTAPAILLIDATGQLREWYALATVAFVGKSLPGISEVGGQNPAEPVALGRPTICGPHMENFRDLLQLLRRHHAIAQISTNAELLPALETLFRDPTARQTLSSHAHRALAQHHGATTRAATALLSADSLLPEKTTCHP